MKFNIKELFWLFGFLLVANILFFISQIPFFEKIHSVPFGYSTGYVHRNDMDYYTYLGFIRESKDGAWAIRPLYSTESNIRTISYAYYIVLGKIASVFQLSSIHMYHISRIIGIEGVFVGIYLLCRKIFEKKFAFLAAGIGLMITPPVNIFGFNFYVAQPKISSAWYYINPLFRVDMLPHHSASAICLFVVIWYLFDFVANSNRKKYLIYMSIFSFLTTIIHPRSAVVIVFGLGIVGVIGFKKKLSARTIYMYPYPSWFHF